MGQGIMLGGSYYPTRRDAILQAASCDRCAELQRRQGAYEKQREAVSVAMQRLSSELVDLEGRTHELELAAIEHGHAADTCPTLRDCAEVHAFVAPWRRA